MFGGEQAVEYIAEILCCTHETYKPMLSQFLKKKNCGQNSHAFLRLYWVGQNNCSDFPIRCYGKLDRTFWPTQLFWFSSYVSGCFFSLSSSSTHPLNIDFPQGSFLSSLFSRPGKRNSFLGHLLPSNAEYCWIFASRWNLTSQHLYTVFLRYSKLYASQTEFSDLQMGFPSYILSLSLCLFGSHISYLLLPVKSLPNNGLIQ